MVKQKREKKPMTAAQRKAAERQRRRALGAVPMEVWCHPDDKEKIKKTARKGLESRGISLTSD